MTKSGLLLTTLLVISLSSLSHTSWAANPLNLYAKPDSTSKIIKTLDAQKPLIPIYYPNKTDNTKTSDTWVKVADPSSGDVGWVQLKAIQGPLVMPKLSAQSFEQETIMTREGDKPVKEKTYRQISYTTPDEDKRAEALGKLFIHMQYRLRDMQMLIDRFIQTLTNDNSIKEDDTLFNDDNLFKPLIQPISEPTPPTHQPSWWEKLKQKFMNS